MLCQTEPCTCELQTLHQKFPKLIILSFLRYSLCSQAVLTLISSLSFSKKKIADNEVAFSLCALNISTVLQGNINISWFKVNKMPNNKVNEKIFNRLSYLESIKELFHV